MQEENFHEIEDNIPYTHYFIYKGKQYPFKIDFFKYSSRYVFRILSELENKKNVQLVDEEIEKEDILTEDGIISFIKYAQHEKIHFTKENVHTLNYLSKKYEIQSLQEKTIKYIEDHQIDLIIDILIFNTEKSTEDKRIYESILSEHLLEHIKDERLYRLSLPTLYRIIKEYEEKRKEKLCQNQIEEESNDNDSTMKSKDIKDDQERDKLFEFLFKCLDIYKKNASVLFSLVDFGENKLEYFNRLSSDYSKIFDFHFIKTQTVDLIYKEVNDILSKSYLNEEKIKQQEIKIQSLEKTISELNTDLNEMKSILSQTSSKVTNEIETNQKEQNIKINQIQEQSKNEINQLKIMVNELKDEISKISEQKVNSVFTGCSSLTEITIPSSVTTIENSAFAGCSSLAKITIPSSVTEIGNDSFNGCSSLAKITIPLSVTLIGNYAFNGCSSLTQITIPSSVTSIGNGVFSGCSSLTKIIIASSVTSIGNYTFSGCSSLTQITIPSSVIEIGNDAFRECSSLTQIAIPTFIAEIRDSTFSGCSSLTQITIPTSVTSIGYSAFNECSSLTQITIPSSVTSIGNYAFSKCSSLTQISIPSSLIKYLIPTGKAWDMKDNDYNCFSIEDKSCEVISSSIYENERFAKYLFDGQKEQNGKNNVWASVYEDPNAFIQINFAQPVISNVIKITSRNSDFYQQTPTHFELFGINNQNQEESLSKIRVSWEKDQTKLFPFINEKPYSKYKFKFYEFKFNGHVAIAELNLGQI